MKAFSALFFLLASMLSYASNFPNLRQEDLVLDGTVAGNASQDKIKSCAEFAKSIEEVFSYLSSADRISAEAAHKDFDVYHCSVSGSFEIEQQKYKFTIYAGGLGYVSLPDTSQIILGCKNQCCRTSSSICWEK
jgi:hypothetical protein